ncbi:hypothetical protein KL86PLE_70089 [uncultured Pleomorphomonas sp.]|uniref:Uncharacterized protein n=1 Tax=uncultured Pleomorphomonas sp. TaxID=442121 RepID=A0A212LLB3_9HYPH|nr:hypothetical protein KL86PLE_70089 [uncultured Pleomorphomonas sp.]
MARADLHELGQPALHAAGRQGRGHRHDRQQHRPLPFLHGTLRTVIRKVADFSDGANARKLEPEQGREPLAPAT